MNFDVKLKNENRPNGDIYVKAYAVRSDGATGGSGFLLTSLELSRAEDRQGLISFYEGRVLSGAIRDAYLASNPEAA